MGLPYETLELIQNTAVEAARPQYFKVECEPKHVYHIRQQDGSYKREHATRKTLNSIINDFDAMAERIVRADNTHSSVWYTTDGLVAILGEDYRDRITMPLTLSKQMKELLEWNRASLSMKTMEHKEIYRAFRTLFRGCFPDKPDILAVISRIKIVTGEEMNASRTASKVSMDRAMMAEANGTDQIPETLKFGVPFFEETVCEYTATINTVFELDPETKKFTIYILPGEIAAAIQGAELYLRNAIDRALTKRFVSTTEDAGAHAYPIYAGRPFTKPTDE